MALDMYTKAQLKYLFAFAALFLIVSNAISSDLTRAGWVEEAVLYPSQVVLQAKLDTGAKTSSINGRNK